MAEPHPRASCGIVKARERSQAAADARGKKCRITGRSGARPSQRKLEGRALPYQTFGPDPAAVAVDDPLNRGQPDAVPGNSSWGCSRWKGPKSRSA